MTVEFSSYNDRRFKLLVPLSQRIGYFRLQSYTVGFSKVPIDHHEFLSEVRNAAKRSNHIFTVEHDSARSDKFTIYFRIHVETVER